MTDFPDVPEAGAPDAGADDAGADDDPGAPQQGLNTDDGEGPGDAARGSRRKTRRAPRPVTAERLHDKALWYLGQRASSTENLRQVLRRGALRAARHHGTDMAEAEALIEAEIARLTRVGLLDDAAYAETRARALARAGASARKIAAKLAEKGVAEPEVSSALAALQAESPDDPERIAAIRLARKRRLGPWRPDPDARAARRERDMASLARAGLGFDLVRDIIDAEDPAALEAELDAA
jgi:regulatory protein